MSKEGELFMLFFVFLFFNFVVAFFFFNIQTTTYSYRFNDGYFAHLSL